MDWTPGSKHPNTPATIFKNCYEWDRVRRILISRCGKCGTVITTVFEDVKELVFLCDNPMCRCHTKYASRTHHVCQVCYDMWHSLYMNVKMSNMNYFKELDEKDEKERQERKRKEGFL